MIKYCPFSENEMFFRFSKLNESLRALKKKQCNDTWKVFILKKKNLVNEEFFYCEWTFHRLSIQMAWVMVYSFCQKHFFRIMWQIVFALLINV